MSNQLLSSAIENSTGVIVFSLDVKYCYTSFSLSHFHTMNKIWGVEIQIGQNMLELLKLHKEDDYLKAKANFDRALSGEHFTEIEEYGDEQLQRTFWENRYDPIYNEAKQITGLVVFVLDITRQNTLVKTINETNDRLALAVQAANIGIWEWNIITNEIYWSDEILKIYNLDESFRNLTFEKYLLYVHPEDIDQLNQDIANALKSNTQYHTVHRVTPPDGRMRWIESIGKIIVQHGQPARMIGTVIDITQQKADTNALLKSQEIYQTLTDNMYDMVSQADSEGKFIYLSPSYRTVLGFEDPSVLVGESIFTRVHPDDLPEAMQRFTASMANKTSESAEFRYQNAMGEYVWIETKGNPIINSNGEVETIVLSSREVTERKASEAALQHRDAMLSALAEATSQLAIEPDLWIGLRKAVQIIGEKAGADRVLIFQNETNSTTPTFTLKVKWTSDSLTSKFEYAGTEHFSYALAPTLISELIAKKAYIKHVADIEDIPYRNELSALHVKSIINLPIQVKGQFWGFIGVDECKMDRAITNSEYAILKSFTDTLGTALERKEIEQENKEWQTRYEIIAASSAQVIYDYDISSGRIIWSGNSMEVLGLATAEMGNVDEWGNRIHVDDRDRVTQELEACRLSGGSFQVEYLFQMKSGEYTQLFDRGFFLKDAEGVAYRMLGIMTDISQQKKAELDLKESEARFRALQEASFGGLGLHYKGEILDANKGLSDITGYSYEELKGMNGFRLIAPEYKGTIIEKINSGYDKPYDVIGLRKDGSRYNLEIHGKNIPYQGKTIRVTEFRDISDRKQSEEKILEQNTKLSIIAEDLKRKNEQLEEFTQIVSHNLRSPVSNILSLLDFYENSNNEEEKESFIKMLRESGSKMLNSLHELNEVLKIKQTKDIERQELAFENILQNVTQQLSSQLSHSGAIVLTDFSQAPFITYPSIYLESILMNLLSNALKYKHPDRKPEISFTSFIESGRITLEVRDNGLGIDLKRYGHHIFKLRKTFHKHPESRGIGLFMIKNQIEALGGEILIRSEENIGTTFIVNFHLS